MGQSAAIDWQQKTPANRTTIPWYLWACALAVTSASFGGVWDISWHESIGRDTFWTAPHLFIHLGGILAGVSSACLIFHTTFSPSTGERRGAYLAFLRCSEFPVIPSPSLGLRGTRPKRDSHDFHTRNSPPCTATG